MSPVDQPERSVIPRTFTTCYPLLIYSCVQAEAVTGDTGGESSSAVTSDESLSLPSKSPSLSTLQPTTGEDITDDIGGESRETENR